MDQQFVLKFFIDIGSLINDENFDYSVRCPYLSLCGKYLGAIVYTIDLKTSKPYAPGVVLFKIEEDRIFFLDYLSIRDEKNGYFLSIYDVRFNYESDELIIMAIDVVEKKFCIYIYEFNGTNFESIKQKIDVTENDEINIFDYSQYLFLKETEYTDIIAIYKMHGIFGYIQKESDKWIFKKDIDESKVLDIDSNCYNFWSKEKNLFICNYKDTPKIEIGQNFNPDTKTFDLIQTITPKFEYDQINIDTKHLLNMYGIMLNADLSTMVVIYPFDDNNYGSATILKYDSKTKHYKEMQVINNPFKTSPDISDDKYMLATSAAMNENETVLVLLLNDKQLIVYTKK